MVALKIWNDTTPPEAVLVEDAKATKVNEALEPIQDQLSRIDFECCKPADVAPFHQMVAQIHAKNQINPNACATFGLILFHQDKIAEAKEVYSKGFAGVIAALGDRELRFIWGSLSNRDPLRCMYGYALCCEQLADKVGALMMFQRILALNPNDNQGVRFLIPHLMRDLGAEKEAHAFAKKHGFQLADPEDDD